MKRLFAAALVLAVCCPCAAARTWTDSTGRYKVEAELVDVTDGKVRLRKADGKVVAIPLERLSAADQAFVRGQNSPPTSPGTTAPAAPGTDASWDALSGNTAPEPPEPDGAEKEPARLRKIAFAGNSLDSMAISPDGTLLVCGGQNEQGEGVLRVYALRSSEMVREVKTASAAPSQLWLSPDGARLAALTGEDPAVTLYDCGTWQAERSLTAKEGNCIGCAFSRDGKLLAAIEAGTRVALIDPATGAVVKTLPVEDGLAIAAAFSPVADRLAVGGQEQIALWNTATGKPERKLAIPNGGAVFSIAFSPDGKSLAAGCNDGHVRVWDAETGELRHELPEEAGDYTNVFSVRYSPDGRYLAARAAQPPGSDALSILISLGVGSPVRIWDAATGKQLAEDIDACVCPFVHTCSIAFSPGGKVLATVEDSKYAGVKFWSVEALLQQAGTKE